jgi:hypothetical protein
VQILRDVLDLLILTVVSLRSVLYILENYQPATVFELLESQWTTVDHFAFRHNREMQSALYPHKTPLHQMQPEWQVDLVELLCPSLLVHNLLDQLVFHSLLPYYKY